MIRLSALVFALLFGAALPASALTIVRQPDPAANLVGTEVVLRAGLDRQTPAQNGLSALVAQAILQTPVGSSKQPLESAVAALGGSVTYAIEPRSVRFYLEGVPKTFDQALALFRQALGSPDFSYRSLAAARTALNERSRQNDRLALNVGIAMLNRAFYQNSDAGMPAYGLPATLANFDTADASRFFADHYRRGEAVISAVGNLGALSGEPYATLLDALPQGASQAVALHEPSLPSTTRELIARRDIPVPWLVAQYPAPKLGTRDFAAMLVLSSFLERTLGDVAQVPSVATRSFAQRGVGALYNFDAQPANVIVYVDGGLGDPSRTFATALTIVNVLGHAKLGGDLSEMKALAIGQFVDQTTTLESKAWLGGVFAEAAVPGDYAGATLKQIESVTAADLQHVAAKYLGAPTIALVLPRAQRTQ